MIEQRKIATTGRSRVILLVIAAIAFVPLFVAGIVFFFFPALVPGITTNQGTLVQPSVQLIGYESVMQGKWTMLISVEAECDPACERVLYLSRQVRLGLGKDVSRVRRIILTSGSLSSDFADLLAREHGLATIISLDRDATAVLRNLAIDPEGNPVVFLMDPNGNIMMYYLSSQGGKPMLDDLKLLLKVSNIG